MAQSTPDEKHPRNPIEQSGLPSPELRSRVSAIAFMLTIQAAGILFIGLLVLVFTLLFLFSGPTTRVLASFGCILAIFPTFALFFSCLAVFLFRVASAFGHFQSWSYRWVEFFTQAQHKWGLGYWLAYRHLYDQELRKAFNQPDNEQVEHAK